MTKADLNSKKNTLKRTERLKSKKIITSLFDRKEGSYFVYAPIIVAYKLVDAEKYSIPQIAFTVSKSKFKRAVDRNLIKRKMREAYRLNKHSFLEKLELENKKIALMFIYSKNSLSKIDKIEEAVIKALSGIKFKN